MPDHPATPPRTRARGFTLVELLVALVVMALLSLMSWRGLDAMGRAQTQTQARSDDVQALQSGLAQWRADLDTMATELKPARTGDGNNRAGPLDWNGQVLRITRSSSGTGQPALRVVAWMMGDAQGRKRWLRWQSSELRTPAELEQAWLQAAIWAQSPSEASRARQVAIVPLDDWRIFYYRGDAWSNPASSSDAAALNPDGVRLQLSLPTDQPLAGQITHDWIRPTAVGAKT